VQIVQSFSCVQKLQKKSKEISKAQTFKELLDYELNNGLAKKSDSACIAALWYKRYVVLQSSKNLTNIYGTLCDNNIAI